MMTLIETNSNNKKTKTEPVLSNDNMNEKEVRRCYCCNRVVDHLEVAYNSDSELGDDVRSLPSVVIANEKIIIDQKLMPGFFCPHCGYLLFEKIEDAEEFLALPSRDGNRLFIFDRFISKEYGKTRAVIDDVGEGWYIVHDLVKLLCYPDVKTMISCLDEEEIKVITRFDHKQLGLPETEEKLVLISESGLFSVIFNSSTCKAKSFMKWVFGEVLPSIKKFDMYAANVAIEELKAGDDSLARYVKPFEKTINHLSARAGQVCCSWCDCNN